MINLSKNSALNDNRFISQTYCMLKNNQHYYLQTEGQNTGKIYYQHSFID